jgi:two-component sensor histidine kinase
VLADSGTLHRQILPEYIERFVAAEAVSARELSDFDMEVPMRRPDGEVRWMRLQSRPRRIPEGRVVWDGVQTDITERREAEERIKTSLAEKEVMLKEIHHRVKNNMQVISSLVSLQANGSKDEAVRQVLQEVTYRVRSMVMVHEKLYQSADLAHIDFAEYTRGLLDYLWRAHGAIAAKVRMTFDLEPVSLPTDAAVACGLILNELAVNALEHAFQDRTDGEVTVSLQSGADGRTRLCLADNGVGLPQGLDWRQSGSLGLRLVQMLSKQLDAKVEVSSGHGTKFEIIFENPDAAPPSI